MLFGPRLRSDPQLIFDAKALDCAGAEDRAPYRVGGPIQGMAMDPSNRRLAVIFETVSGPESTAAEASASQLVAIFRTERPRMESRQRKHPTLQPVGFVRGGPSCPVPQAIEFVRNSRPPKTEAGAAGTRRTGRADFRSSRDVGAVLAVTWRDHRTDWSGMAYQATVDYFPILFGN